MRPALSLGCLFFILVGCPVGIWFSRSDYLSAFITCFLPIVFVYYPLMLCGTGMAKEGRYNMIPLVWGRASRWLNGRDSVLRLVEETETNESHELKRIKDKEYIVLFVFYPCYPEAVVNSCSLRLGELGQALAAQRLPQLEQAARLDLADPFAGDAVGARHLFQRARLAVAQIRNAARSPRARAASANAAPRRCARAAGADRPAGRGWWRRDRRGNRPGPVRRRRRAARAG